jgi:hypothetical protein
MRAFLARAETAQEKAPAEADAGADLSEPIRLANEARKKGQLAEAEQLLQAALQKKPGDPASKVVYSSMSPSAFIARLTASMPSLQARSVWMATRASATAARAPSGPSSRGSATVTARTQEQIETQSCSLLPFACEGGGAQKPHGAGHGVAGRRHAFERPDRFGRIAGAFSQSRQKDVRRSLRGNGLEACHRMAEGLVDGSPALELPCASVVRRAPSVTTERCGCQDVVGPIEQVDSAFDVGGFFDEGHRVGPGWIGLDGA